MKIGFSTSVVQRGQSGVGQYVFALLRAFARLDEQHDFTLFVLKGDLPLFAEFADTMRIVPVAECFRRPVVNILWHQMHLPSLARAHRLDVLHIPSYRRLVWSHPCALVATIHDLAPFHIANKYDPLRTFYARVVARRLAQRQNAIIAISRNTARDIFRFFDVPRNHVRVIYNGLDHARFTPEGGPDAAARVRKLWKLDQPYFLYVSRLEHPAKNHVRLIAAFDHFKKATNSNWQLVLAGKDWHGAEAIHEAIAHSPFRHDIRNLGFVTDSDLPLLYRAAGACVYPSLFEGFGMPPVEAMACGCPVLSSDRGALGEVIGDAALIVDPDDVPDLSRKLRAMASDPDLRARLRERGLRQARRFDWAETAAATLELYKLAVSRRVGIHSGCDTDAGLYSRDARETRLHLRTNRGGLPRPR
jgi:glycosyltransferase involved in cell wall biosynthesis